MRILLAGIVAVIVMAVSKPLISSGLKQISKFLEYMQPIPELAWNTFDGSGLHLEAPYTLSADLLDVDQHKLMMTKVVRYSILEGNYGRRFLINGLISEAKPNVTITLDKMIPAAIQAAADRLVALRVVVPAYTVESITISGLPARRVRTTFDVDGEPWNYTIVIIQSGQKIATIEITFAANNSSYEKAASRMLSSVTFK